MTLNETKFLHVLRTIIQLKQRFASQRSTLEKLSSALSWIAGDLRRMEEELTSLEILLRESHHSKTGSCGSESKCADKAAGGGGGE